MIIEPYTWHRVKIASLDMISADTIAVKVAYPADFTFKAGQYTILRIINTFGQRLIRQYSFSSAPHINWIEFTIQKELGGEVTTWFHEHAQPGDQFEISQPFGSFTLPDQNRPLLCIAGGVGIAPFMSMLRAKKSELSMHILYSVREETQICFRDELAPVTTFFATNHQGRIGANDIKPYIEKNPLIYLCGSRQFVEAMQQHAMALDVPPHDVKRELFTL